MEMEDGVLSESDTELKKGFFEDGNTGLRLENGDEDIWEEIPKNTKGKMKRLEEKDWNDNY